tara:strand:- start:34 stop:300 length:267 start_codon:yes stop_codon:yes gene_type:complete
MRELTLFNTIHGIENNNTNIDKRETTENDTSIFDNVKDQENKIVDWLNSSTGEPILASVILIFFLIISFPLIKKVIKVIFFPPKIKSD